MSAGRPVSYTVEQRTHWIEMAKSGLSANKISAREGVSWDVVARALKSAGEFKRTYRGKLSEDQRAAVVERATAGEPQVAIAASLGVTKRAVWEILNVRGTEAAKTGTKWGAALGESRKDAFSLITPESAYWFGYLLCDGGIYTSAGAKHGRITIAQSERHREHLEALHRFVGTSTKLLSGSHYDPAGTRQKHVTLQFTSPGIQRDLERYGLVGLKPMRFCRDDRLLVDPHFWRGCVDADGNLATDRSRLYLSGHAPLLDQWATWCVLSVGCAPRRHKQPGCLVDTLDGAAARHMAATLYLEKPGACLAEKLNNAAKMKRPGGYPPGLRDLENVGQ